MFTLMDMTCLNNCTIYYNPLQIAYVTLNTKDSALLYTTNLTFKQDCMTIQSID